MQQAEQLTVCMYHQSHPSGCILPMWETEVMSRIFSFFHFSFYFLHSLLLKSTMRCNYVLQLFKTILYLRMYLNTYFKMLWSCLFKLPCLLFAILCLFWIHCAHIRYFYVSLYLVGTESFWDSHRPRAIKLPCVCAVFPNRSSSWNPCEIRTVWNYICLYTASINIYYISYMSFCYAGYHVSM